MTEYSLHRKEDIAKVRELLNAIEPEMGYGFYRPANPHNFQPDHESCSPEEIAAHEAACNAYTRGEYTPEKGDGWVTPDLHLLKAPWGIGTYQYTDPNIAEALALLDAGKYVSVVGNVGQMGVVWECVDIPMGKTLYAITQPDKEKAE